MLAYIVDDERTHLDLIADHAHLAGLLEHILAHEVSGLGVEVAQPNGGHEIGPRAGEVDEVLDDGEVVMIGILCGVISTQMNNT